MSSEKSPRPDAESENIMKLKKGHDVHVWTSGLWAPGWKFVALSDELVTVQKGADTTRVPQSHIGELVEAELDEAKRRAVRICKEKGKNSSECGRAALDVSRLQGLVDAWKKP
jgi:hypothetical protein